MGDIQAIVGEHTGQIAALERGQNEATDDRRELFKLVREIHSDVQELKGRAICTNPNACLSLAPQVTAQGEKIIDLAMWRNLVVGGSVVVWLVLASLFYAAWDYAREHFVIQAK